MTSDTITAAADEKVVRPQTPARPRAWRVFVGASVVAMMLGVGWIAGVKTRETVDLAQLSSALWARADHTAASLGTWVKGLWPEQPTGSARSFSASDERVTPDASAEAGVERISRKIDEARASSEALIEGLRATLDRLASSMDANQRQLIAKVESLSDRLERVEQNSPATAGPLMVKLQELNERLDRIERSAAAVALSQLPAPASGNSPAAKPDAGAGIAAAPAPVAPKPSEKVQSPAETKRIADWVVREVINGTAILQGPRGVIGVAKGDLVPGVGRVQSIARQGGRWIVATNKGVITAR